MTFSDDGWIKEYSIIDAERVHAIGAIILWWNHCERNLLLIFSHILGLSLRAGWIVGHDLGDVALSTKIREGLNWGNLENEHKSVIISYLDAYDICRQNRNALAHFTANIQDHKAEFTKASFVRMKGVTGNQTQIPSTLADVRRVAEETQALMLYSWKIHKELSSLREGRHSVWPQEVAKPELLVRPPPQNSRQPKQPQKPSRRERRKP